MASIGTFFGLNTAVNALEAIQQAQAVISNNIGNASTPGYSVEVANLTEAPPFPPEPSSAAPVMAGQLGQGSMVQSVTRVTDSFYNQMVRNNLTDHSGHSTLYTNLNQIQQIFNEPSTSGLQSAIDNFFSSWQTLSTQPQSMAAREAVIQQANNLTTAFSTIQGQLADVMNNLNSQVSGGQASQITQVNQYAQQLAQINQQIARVTSVGQSPNQLLDQKDGILNNLAKLGNLQYTENANGTVDVTFGSVPIVSTSSTPAKAFTTADVANLTSGEIWANQQGISTAQSLWNSVGNLLNSIATGVNNQLEQGYQYNSNNTGSQNDLFTFNPQTRTLAGVSTTYTTVSVTSNFQPQQIAAALNPNSPGDGSNATAIANLQNSTTLQNSAGTSLGATPDDSFSSVIADLGAQTAAAKNNQTTSSSLLQESQSLQQSVSGVNINDQVAQMVEYQNIYNAASKFIEIQNQMLQTLIQGV
ncbi:flagellar hook-associated protein FlgK [Alicyclobacillus tolerans]|uniref:flagellar hook-associated protein FlgK n=1 Tax=Alicyclobacillus tolerans TaxID=90970 RepID=UPI001F0039AA|nr:flagellar hook-associated protein FlgK [Alicyclobacillus tolerans]MCF8567755.1 flagellar hook-associated protein FlgK [Alicyclobacillus tolerans]